jgi:hypothetical protein
MPRNSARSALRHSIVVKSLLLGTILGSGLAAPALAQTASAPEAFLNLDEHGVDLESGAFNLDMVEGDIGPDNGGVKMIRYYGQSGYRDNWSGDLRKTYEGSTEVVVINFGKISERFTKQGGVWVAAKANGGRLTEVTADTEFHYVTSGGTTIKYKTPLALGFQSPDPTPTLNMPGAYCNSTNSVTCGVPVEKLDADGQKYTLTWRIAEQCVYPQGGFGIEFPENGELECAITYRLSDVRSSSSFGLKIKYQSDQDFSGSQTNPGPPPTGWFIRSGVKFIDLSQTYCDPNAANCDGIAGSWPTVTYTTPSAGVFEIVNDRSGTWRLDSTGGTFKIRRPGQSTDSTSVTYSGGKVSSITDRGQSKSYSW